MLIIILITSLLSADCEVTKFKIQKLLRKEKPHEYLYKLNKPKLLKEADLAYAEAFKQPYQHDYIKNILKDPNKAVIFYKAIYKNKPENLYLIIVLQELMTKQLMPLIIMN